tara:strand:- start:316 stop:843 length:528 start_codon:yes stop_codon:yes gene_type:complete
MKQQQQPQFKEEKMTSPITGGKNCFRVYTEPTSIEYYLCMGSGFMSHSDFTEDSSTLKGLLSNSPKLVQDLKWEDEDTGLTWLPVTLNMGDMGIVYPEGTPENWVWKLAKPKPIPEEEQINYPIPGKEGEYYVSKLDIENADVFDKGDFIGACINLGVIKDQDGIDISSLLGFQS